ncbi:MAG TPA: hypothetical protein VKF63_12410 [Terracidiphilus sp.]|nr:hypothetical protein [Terracidiphilus sp.]
MGNFYFEQLLQTALQGIDGFNITSTVLGVAGSILLLSLLYSCYQAFAGGGDVRSLAVSGVVYLVLGLVFVNYGAVFRDVVGMFNSVADFIYTSVGAGDVFSQWLSDLSSYFSQNGWSSLWGLVTGGLSGLLGALLIMVAFVIFPLSYTVFTLFYALYGTVLYVVGPFVLALLPARGMNQLARTYLVNLMVFASWGVIYAILQALMSAVNLGSLNQVLNANGILNSFLGSGQVVLLALASIVFSIAIAFIPYIASRIVRGDVGSTLLALGGAALTVASTAASLAGKAVLGGSSGYGGNADDHHDGGGGGGGGGKSDDDDGDRRRRVAVGGGSRPPRPLSGEGTSSSGQSGASSSPSFLWNPDTGQLWSRSSGGWRSAGMVNDPLDNPSIRNGESCGLTSNSSPPQSTQSAAGSSGSAGRVG